MMHHEHVLDVFAHVGALDVVVFEVFEGGNHHIGIHFHHEGYGALLPYVVGADAWIGLGDLENLVVWIVGHVVDDAIGVLKQVLDAPLEILVEARAL